MTLIQRDFDYTLPDFAAIKERLISAIQSVFTTWTDFLRASFENILLESFAFNHDVFMGYQTQRIRETRLATVVSRPTARRLAVVHCGYRPTEATAAQALVTLSIPAVTPGDVIIPAGTVISTAGENQVRGQLLSAVTITAGDTDEDGTWENSTPITDTFLSSGLPLQPFPLSQSPFLWGSAEFSDDSGAWTEVENRANSLPTDKHFVVTIDDEGFAQIETGDGTYGAIPSGTVTITYKVGGGVVGNVAANSLTRITGSFTDTLANPVIVSSINPSAASGGADREEVELIRLKAPAALRAQERSVSREDMQTNAERVASVARALVLTKNERPGIAENSGHVYLVIFGTKTNSGRYRPASATALDKTNAETALTETYPVMATFELLFQDTVFEIVQFRIPVLFEDGYVKDNVAQDIYDALDDLFAVSLSDADGKIPNEEMFFGYEGDGELPWSTLFPVVANVPGVRKIDEDLFEPVNDVILEDYEFPKLGNVTIIDVEVPTNIWVF